MATRKPPATITPDPATGMPPGADPDAWGVLVRPPADQLQAMDDADDDAEMEIGARLRSAFGSDAGTSARVSVYRLDAYTKKREFCVNYTPEQFIEGGFDLVKREFGAGDYEFRSYGSRGLIPGGRGSFSIAKTMTPTAPAASAVSSELAQILGMLAQGQRDTLATLQAMANKPPEDPQQAMQNTLAMLRTMREVFAPAAAPVAPTAAPVDPLAQITQLAGAMRAMREISSEFSPPADTDNPLSMLTPILGMVGDAMRARQGLPPAGNSNEIPALSAPASIAGAMPPQPDHGAGNQSETEGENDVSFLILQGAVRKLEELAAANAAPEEGGRFIHESLPDALLIYLNYPNWFEILAGFAPTLTPHRVWIEAAKAHADTLFAADPAG